MSKSYSSADLLRQLQQSGVELWVDTDNGDAKLRYRAPKGVMNQDVLNDLKTHKTDIINLLSAGNTAEPELRALPRDTALPLSYAQQRIWFLDELEPDNPFYNVTLAKRVRGSIDAAVLRQAVHHVINRHEVLRSFCITRDDSAELQIDNNIAADGAWFSEQRAPEGIGEAELSELVNAEGRRPVRLAEAPLLRILLLRVSDDDAVLVVTTHHFVVDGWSCGLLMREISQAYNALLEGNEPVLSELPVQYLDFAGWQNEYLKGPAMQSQSDYWRQQLQGLTTLNLPTDLPRPAVQSYKGDLYDFTLPEELLKKLKTFSQQMGVTLYMSLLAGFQSLLYRYTQQDDVVVGAAVSNRHFSSLENLIGPFVNALVLRGDVSGNPSFRELVLRARDTAADAFAHQDIPFEVLVEQLKPERDRSRSPLFQVLFVVHQYDADEELSLAGTDCSDYPVKPGTTMYDLFLQLIEIDGQLNGSIEYSTDLFTEATVARLVTHLEALLDAAVADPEAAIIDLPLLTAAERQDILTRHNDTAEDYPHDAGMHQLFENTADARPEKTAVVFDGHSTSYGELNARANRFAGHLRKQGIGPGTMVGVYLERCTDMLTATLGIMKTGAAYVPLDPAFPDERISFMMSDAELAAVVVDTSQAVTLPETDASIIDLAGIDLNAGPAEPVNGFTDAASLAYMIYTSGSTGLPKGVQLPHRAVVNFLYTMKHRPGMRPDDVMVAVTTLSFDIAVLELFLPLLAGGTVVIASREESADGERLSNLISTSKATIMQATPATWRVLLNDNWDGEAQRGGMKVLCGGEALPRSLADRILATGVELWNMYGPTETTIWSSVSKVSASGPVTIGKPIGNTQMYILDDTLNPVPNGVPGELCIGGDGLAIGYFKRDELTAEKFISNPFGPGRIYKTGDLARYLPEGDIECLGRNDHQVKIRGYRMELGEIETALTAHSAVKDSVVTAHEYREGDTRLVAYVVTDEDGISDEQIERWKGEHLDQWKDLWEGAYVDGGEVLDPRFNISGWNSSFSGEPIPAEEMRAWVDSTVERINELAPKKVLEIGAGTGLFVSRVAPACEEYVATDFSPASINAIDDLAKRFDDLSHVETLQTAADELEGLQGRQFDTVIINSVVQYFPDADYLHRVLSKVSELVTDGGNIFIGDVRNLTLLESFHTSVQMAHAAAGDEELSLEQLGQRVRQRVEQEEELLLNAGFFSNLTGSIPRVSNVSLQIKDGEHYNELTAFRYDVVLQLGGQRQQALPEQIDWQIANLSLDGLPAALEQAAADGVLITNIPDARLARETLLTGLIAGDPQLPVATACGQLANARDGVVPAVFFDAIKTHGYRLETIATTPGYFNAWIVAEDRSEDRGEDLCEGLGEGLTACLNSTETANDPMAGRLQRSLIPELRDSLKAGLPEYMVPGVYSILEAFPLTPNGKIDRNALPVPQSQITQTYVPPESDTEKTLAAIWEDILSTGQVGIDDDFFDLGGHSLLATQLISRIRDGLGVSLPLNALFETPTVRGLAQAVGTMRWALNEEPEFGDDSDLEEIEL